MKSYFCGWLCKRLVKATLISLRFKPFLEWIYCTMYNIVHQVHCTMYNIVYHVHCTFDVKKEEWLFRVLRNLTINIIVSRFRIQRSLLSLIRFEIYLFILILNHIHFLYSTYIFVTFSWNSPCIVLVFSLYSPCIHLVFFLYSPCIFLVFSLYSPCIHRVFSLYSPSILLIFSLYST